MSGTGWPERTDWDVEAQAAWTKGRRKQLIELAAKQRSDGSARLSEFPTTLSKSNRNAQQSLQAFHG